MPKALRSLSVLYRAVLVMATLVFASLDLKADGCMPDVGARATGGSCWCAMEDGFPRCHGVYDMIITVDKGCTGCCTAPRSCRKNNTWIWLPAGLERACVGSPFAMSCNEEGACAAAADYTPAPGQIGIRDCSCQ